MMYNTKYLPENFENTKYLPENFEQCRLEKTILRQFPYNLNVRSSWNALIQDGGKYHEKAYRKASKDRSMVQ